MDIHINQQTLSVAETATLAEALNAYGAKPPFAAAINGQFVPKTQYTARVLAQGDKIDVVQPVAGG
ncbi:MULTISPECIES: sulfur carrier protein ThiS [Pandoraea]|jgi:sulfur carrier protein|uniref:Thiamine biosynthesis protein ThiS n=1 Tax=Pandoraea pnomenusa TaxID=93220 RepID=A0A378YMF0_9BURK|nr:MULTISPECIES: sulfur carrier protein ThiS [Pandoraea]AHB04061.1 thiamine biosynthesis protein ThiS [Pandoraea pnomenusa 3kgm]AHN76160.1 thiamine biosynthesis protein ThiS [Pandoraea pnomenusa]AIU27260.1 thiamine biosynthesis protein ThiS [Pandoraea pnomenusa]ANC44419.1 thiamine biosynthesis protein ThiS [Pandoraea pnomenusa]APD11704.1 thiamine biosynthesis protein ThiS [Pandoraea pnomenusa]